MRLPILLVALAATACASSPPQAPLVHRVEHAEHWKKEFDGPERDAWQKPDAVIAAMKIAPGMTAGSAGTDLALIASKPEDVQEVRKRARAALGR